MSLFLENALHGSFLPFELPCREDSLPVFAKKSLPYLTLGFLEIAVSEWAFSSTRSFPVVWFRSLSSLGNGFQILIDVLLTLLFLSFVSYSFGVLLLYILRPAERTVKHFLLFSLEKGRKHWGTRT